VSLHGVNSGGNPGLDAGSPITVGGMLHGHDNEVPRY